MLQPAIAKNSLKSLIFGRTEGQNYDS